MTEEEHAEWVRQATGESLVTKSAGPMTRAAGNDAWNAYFKRMERKQRESLEKVVYEMGRRFAELDVALRLKIQSTLLNAREELAAMREQNARLVAENGKLIEETERLLKAHPRLVKSG